MDFKQEKLLIKMWLDGSTGLQIANHLGTTRNAIMGRLKRLRDRGVIEYRTVPIKRSRKVAPMAGHSLPIKNRRILREIKMGKRELPQVLVPLKEKHSLKSPVWFRDLTLLSCRFPLNDGAPQNLLFCGTERKENSSYCERHHKICYVAGTSEYDRSKKRQGKKFKYDRSAQPAYTN